MSSNKLTRRTAATVAAGLIALGGLAVGFVSPVDASQTPATTYSCHAAALPQPMKATVVGNIVLPSRVKVGKSLAGIPVTMKVTLNGNQIRGLARLLHFHKLGGSVTKAALQVCRTNKLALGTLTIPSTKVPGTGNMKLKASGKTGRTAHAPTRVGTYTVRMPKSFTFTPKSDAKIQTGPLACTLVGRTGSFGTMRVHR